MSWHVVRHDGDASYRWVRESQLDGGTGRRLVVIGKNPSTADGMRGDSTSRAVERFAQAQGFDRVCLVNLFALRSPHPRDLEARDGLEVPLLEAVGDRNDLVLREETEQASAVVAAWGAPAPGMKLKERYVRRIEDVLALLADRRLSMCGPLTGKGYPLHGYSWGGLRPGLELLPAPHDVLRPPGVRSRSAVRG